MAGIYIHVPFCTSKCHYCNFFSVASKRYREGFAKFLLLEMKQRAFELCDEKVMTIYLGGGTPSLLPPEVIGSLIQGCRDLFNVAEDAEITMEANPDDLTDEYLVGIKRCGVNRLSIGVQSFHDEDLRLINRRHSGQEAHEAVCRANMAGFKDITLDLIYGIPGAEDARWQENVHQLIALNVSHFSAYALTIEEGTALNWMIKKGKCLPVDEEQAVRQYEYLIDMALQSGYEHYEVSNFARPGCYSRHNTAYWQGNMYMGLGPAAHSFDGMSRRWNVSGISGYIDSVNSGEVAFEREVLTENNRYNEFVMTGLRTMWGVDCQMLEKMFGKDVMTCYQQAVSPFITRGWVVFIDGVYKLTRQGVLFADYIASELFRV